SKKEYKVKYRHKNGNIYTNTLLGISIKILVRNGSIVDILSIEEAPKRPKPRPVAIKKPVFRKPKPKFQLAESPKKKMMKDRVKQNLSEPLPAPKPIIEKNINNEVYKAVKTGEVSKKTAKKTGDLKVMLGVVLLAILTYKFLFSR
ncbi:hypothetical protein, partial [Thermococcus sp. ES12]